MDWWNDYFTYAVCVFLVLAVYQLVLALRSNSRRRTLISWADFSVYDRRLFAEGRSVPSSRLLQGIEHRSQRLEMQAKFLGAQCGERLPEAELEFFEECGPVFAEYFSAHAGLTDTSRSHAKLEGLLARTNQLAMLLIDADAMELLDRVVDWRVQVVLWADITCRFAPGLAKGGRD